MFLNRTEACQGHKESKQQVEQNLNSALLGTRLLPYHISTVHLILTHLHFDRQACIRSISFPEKTRGKYLFEAVDELPSSEDLEGQGPWKKQIRWDEPAILHHFSSRSMCCFKRGTKQVENDSTFMN